MKVNEPRKEHVDGTAKVSHSPRAAMILTICLTLLTAGLILRFRHIRDANMFLTVANYLTFVTVIGFTDARRTGRQLMFIYWCSAVLLAGSYVFKVFIQ